MWSAGRRAETQISATRQEMQASLAAQDQSVIAQINNLMQSVAQQLGQVRQEMQTGIAGFRKLAADAQRGVSQQLHSATEAVRHISLQLGAVQKTGTISRKFRRTCSRFWAA